MCVCVCCAVCWSVCDVLTWFRVHEQLFVARCCAAVTPFVELCEHSYDIVFNKFNSNSYCLVERTTISPWSCVNIGRARAIGDEAGRFAISQKLFMRNFRSKQIFIPDSIIYILSKNETIRPAVSWDKGEILTSLRGSETEDLDIIKNSSWKSFTRKINPFQTHSLTYSQKMQRFGRLEVVGGPFPASSYHPKIESWGTQRAITFERMIGLGRAAACSVQNSNAKVIVVPFARKMKSLAL